MSTPAPLPASRTFILPERRTGSQEDIFRMARVKIGIESPRKRYSNRRRRQRCRIRQTGGATAAVLPKPRPADGGSTHRTSKSATGCWRHWFRFQSAGSGGAGRADLPCEAGGHISVPGKPVPAEPDDRQIELSIILVPEVLAHLRLQFAGQLVVESGQWSTNLPPRPSWHPKSRAGEDCPFPFFCGQPA